ncbi:MAG: excinuclease ABC subunit UvrC [Nitrospirae bacterium]|nr:excinuclease ABC subunit UvrC [Nitrospirota bacterium]
MKDKLLLLPESPGVYLMKDHKAGVIYVGKANSLIDRVKSYFQKSTTLSPRIETMVKHIADIEWMVTESELEALILESNLIKKYKPKYNIILRDDKNYPYLRLYMDDKFPRIEVVRRIKPDSGLYFGPYVPVHAMRETLKLIKRTFPLATCKLDLNKKYDRPCIEYEIGRCSGPCIGEISEAGYKKIVRDVRLFLEGKDKELQRSLKGRMEEEAEKLNFEEAARLRDSIFRIEMLLKRQRIISAETGDTDVIGFARDGNYTALQILFFRGGMLVGRKGIFYDHSRDISDEEILSSFIEQYYSRDVLIPAEVLIHVKIPDMELVEKWLTEKKGKKVLITVPVRGNKAGMLRLAVENAMHTPPKLVPSPLRGEGKGGGEVLDVLKEILSLPSIPERIEAFDISNILGAEAVGSMVVWENGGLRKDEYRHFKIKTVTGADDFAMMGEVVQRRYSRVLEEGGGLPDLILIDGGKGQLNSAIRELKEIGINDIRIIGLAKAREEKGERVFLPDSPDPIELDMTSPATHLLQNIRDEAHRFAISYHRKLRGKEGMLSELDKIKGIGRARKIALLKYFGSVDVLKKAGVEELMKAPKMTEKVAKELYEELRSKK